MQHLSIAYSYREYAERAITVPDHVDAEDIDEDGVRALLSTYPEDGDGGDTIEFSEDEEFDFSHVEVIDQTHGAPVRDSKTIPEIAALVDARTPYLEVWSRGYLTTGGSYLIASLGAGNDDDADHDLVLVLPARLSPDQPRVVVLRPSVSDRFVAELEAALA